MKSTATKESVTTIYTNNPRRRKLATLRMTLRRVRGDKTANPIDVETECRRLDSEIAALENPDTLPPAA